MNADGTILPIPREGALLAPQCNEGCWVLGDLLEKAEEERGSHLPSVRWGEL